MTTNNSTNTPRLTLDGQFVAGRTGFLPTVAQFVNGSGINITFDPLTGNMTIACTSAGMSTVVVTASTQTMSVNTQYIANRNGSPIGFTLPTTAAVGDVIRVLGKGTGGFIIEQSSSQQIFMDTTSTTLGATGSITAADQYNSLELVCITANTEFTCIGPVGFFTFA